MAEVQLPDAASTSRTLESLTAGRGPDRRQAVAAEPVHGQRLQPARRPRPAQPRAGRGGAEAVRRAQATGASRCSPRSTSSTRPFQQIAVGQRLRLQPAADHGPGQRRRASSSRCRACRRAAAGAGAGRARADGGGARRARARRRLHHLRRGDAADLPQARPRAGADARHLDHRHLLAHCRPRWAATTPTTSTCSAAPGR